MKAPKPNFTKVLPPTGTHVARLIGLIYLGTIEGEWKGKPTSTYKLRLTWELPLKKTSFKEGEPEKPFVVSKEVGFSMGNKSTLRPLVEGIIGTTLTDEEAYNFDIEQIVSNSCLITIAHEESRNGKFASVKNTSPLMEGMICPPPVNNIKILSYEKWNQEYFESLPSFIQDKMKATPEYAKLFGINVLSEEETAQIKALREGGQNKVEDINPHNIPF